MILNIDKHTMARHCKAMYYRILVIAKHWEVYTEQLESYFMANDMTTGGS